MSDIVERLRALAKAEHDDLSIADEAADMILELRGVLQEIVDRVQVLKPIIYAKRLDTN